MTPFDPLTVPLRGSNLIEASAGTGKTYSIAILVLRLLLERGLSIREILMVTFTKAAVAELEERIRLFIRSALKASKGYSISDKTIQDLVGEAMERQGASNVQALLGEAVLFLDETSVLTIHSFCQQTLAEFAFETGQVFGAGLAQDTTTVLAGEIHKFWRKEITTLPIPLLAPLLEAGLSQESITAIVREHLNGKKFIQFDPGEPYSICAADHQKWIEDLRELNQKEAELRACLESHIKAEQAHLVKISTGNAHAKKNVLPLLDRPGELVAYISAKRGSAYIQTLYPDLLERHDACESIAEERNGLVRQIIDRLFCHAIRQAEAGMEAYKHRNNLMSFDDLITLLHRALMRADSEPLVAGLQKKYGAVFIDEFQDTDRLQYDIFQKAFGSGPVLFYIGDPKQSIYAWRKADIFTYFKAKGSVDTIYGMNTNYRSAAPLIEAMNVFFKPHAGFDTFFFAGSEDAVDYIPVQAPAAGTKEQLLADGKPVPPMTLLSLPNKSAICAGVAGQVAALLQGTFTIGGPAGGRKITPADIGILVRSHSEGWDVKAALAACGIPAVTICEEKVLQSPEAGHLLFVLKAMEDPCPAHINRALLSPFTGLTVADIRSLNNELAVELFKKFKTTWEEDGVYTALTDFVAAYRVRQVLLHRHTEGGERIITNLYQLMELVHKVQTHKMLSPPELLGWLKRGMEGMETEGDEYEQRVESDEEAVKIVTIHKSKGLEYNIVLAPFLDFGTDKPKIRHCSFRHPQTGDYVAAHKDALTGEQQNWLTVQTEQENRRLLYVAITRAACACFIFRNEHTKTSTLGTFLAALTLPVGSLIRTAVAPEVPQGFFYGGNEPEVRPVVPTQQPVQFRLLQAAWRRMSYTGLAAAHEHGAKARPAEPMEGYDGFVFHQLARGSQTGNLLHFLFEKAPFTDSGRWEAVAKEAIRRFMPKHEELYLPLLQDMLHQVLHARIEVDGYAFQLSEVGFDKRLHELEFDFPVPVYKPHLLHQLSTDSMHVAVKPLPPIEGIMNGKMDLFFECGGRYFILDWKSNYLGGSTADYGPDKLRAAMNDSNYHLQYLLYTLAAMKYLKSRRPDFDYARDFGGVIYLFVRGVRKEGDTGIFTCKPTLAQVQRLEEILTGK